MARRVESREHAASHFADSTGAVGFVTGKLAEPALRRALDAIAPELPFDARVIRLEIAVASLMTTDWIAKRLEVPDGVERIVLPGLCRGDPEALAASCGVAVERGPDDLRDLARWLGRDAERVSDYGAYSIEIIAEINHVPRLALAETLAIARRYRNSGADVIDVGLDPGDPWRGVADTVRAIRDEGFRVSVDSMNPREIEDAVGAGAELVLSIDSSNIDVAKGLPAEVVLVPDDPATLAGLERNIELLSSWGARFRIDPILEPIAFGFAASLGRYLDVRRRHPDAAMMMGIGNLTELTDADSAAINLVLLGICEELGIRSVLTTEVIHWAQSSVKECDLARRLVHHACDHGTLPKHLEPGLHLLRDPERREYGVEFLRDLAASIRDRNYRIFAEGGRLHVMNRDVHLEGDDAFEIFAALDLDDASHAFYLGYELAKATTALTLDKCYTQDRALRWGYLTREERSHRGDERGSDQLSKPGAGTNDADENDAGPERAEGSRP